MTILEKFLMYSPEKPYQEPYIGKVGEADVLKIQVSGNGTCSIKAYGRLSPLMDEEELSAIKDTDYSIVSIIASSGIYTIPCEGYNEVKLEATIPGEGMSCYIVRGESSDD